MDDKLRQDILARLQRDYKFRSTSGPWMRGGRCPDCRGKELYISTEKPWVLRCGRENKCGHEWSTRDLYSELFDNWSDRHPQRPDDPHAAAKAYLRDARGLNVVKLAGAFSQENYFDRKANAGSATVRFQMPEGGWWERLIDRPHRFGKKKANIKYGYSFRGHAWQHPSLSMEDLATASEIWIAEGIFDAVALAEAFESERPGARAVSSISTNNYPAKWLEALAEAVAARGTSARRPVLVFAFDVGPAGVRYARRWVDQARQDGWTARAAQVRPDGEGTKLDWNDLHQRGMLEAEQLDAYLENGDITTAENAAEKAFLLYRRSRRAEFPLTFKSRQLWARFAAERINELIQSYGEDKTLAALSNEEKWDRAAREAVEITEIANCTFRALYFQRDAALNDSTYYLRIDFPGKQDTVKANFPGPAMAGGGEFKKRLISVAPGAIYTGSTWQLDKLMERQLDGIRTVDALYFSGYSIEHNAWMFDDIAVTDGRVVPLNDEDYFEIGKVGVKPTGATGEFAIDYDPNHADYSWWPDLYASFGPLGLVSLAYWLLSLFAEQVRRDQQSLGFLEISGEPGSGKSTLLMFLWKLVGRRHNYEGFDPASATAAGIARELVKYGNLPVVFLEGDRKKDQPSTRKFDWSELKKIYNGHSPRTRGIANGGTDTFSPPFRGALVIAQNDPIREAEEAVLERIMPLKVDKSRFSPEGKAAGNRLKRHDVEDVSHWMIAMIRQERQIIDHYHARFTHHEDRLLAHPEVQNDRLAFNHAQLAAALDCLAQAMVVDGKATISPAELNDGHQLIEQMCLAQHGALGADHPIIAQFWESFDYLDQKMTEGKSEAECAGLNHHRKQAQGLIALSMPEVEQAFAHYRMTIPGASMLELKKMLPTSKARKFIRSGQVNCRDGRNRHCWIFQCDPQTKTEGLPI
ncbi:toprim domain-containing protein [Altericroceibacterium endophyticum]|uniref:Bifunctional DNA primase/helicase n=1 Tax=Altericroceibacterium endophyticum TaxID=1808508 RepID=A0A6I4T935_9SPHN|nr:toprim domain-containing protein [Altericroceibacterium endophyticum]MXO66275.1 bifunctional DNA primase/helicase [Altericroceibacterium endophyticum]